MMKKYLNISLAYAIAAMAGGVFYREFTKLNRFDSVTALGKVHTHLFLLGMMMFLLVALFVSCRQELTERKGFRAFQRSRGLRQTQSRLSSSLSRAQPFYFQAVELLFLSKRTQ